MEENGYIKADKIYPFDKVLKVLILWAIPKRVRPNHVTILRFVTTPLVVALIWQERYEIGIIAFVAVALTDAVDGALARTRDQITKWGMLYDPVADKLLIGVILYILVFKFLAFHIALLVIGLDLAIILGAFAKRKSGIRIQANMWGKLKMITQSTGVGLLLLGTILSSGGVMMAATYVFYLAIGFAIASMVTRAV